MSNLINIYGGPGTGKTTVAAVLFARMKQKGMFVDMCMEYAKELVYTGKLRGTNEYAIWDEQRRRHNVMLHGGVDFVITDAPLMQKVVYSQLFSGATDRELGDMVLEAENTELRYTRSLDIMLPEPPKEIDLKGRVHGYFDSLRIHNHTRQLLQNHGHLFYPVGGINEVIEVVDNWIERYGL